VANLARFPRLERVWFERMPVTMSGYAKLAKLTGLKAYRTHYASRYWDDNGISNGPVVTGDFQRSANDMSKLEVLEFKHLFGTDGTAIDELPAFPNLWKLIVDNESAHAEASAFIAKQTNLRWLEIHRTKMTPEQIRTALRPLKKLERLHLKCEGGNAQAGIDVLNKLDHPNLEYIWIFSCSNGGPNVAGVKKDFNDPSSGGGSGAFVWDDCPL
jgi:hypothetical protein